MICYHIDDKTAPLFYYLDTKLKQTHGVTRRSFNLLYIRCMKTILSGLVCIAILLFGGCKEKVKPGTASSIIGIGQMPSVVNDPTGKLHVVFGEGDSILYAVSTDQGQSFSNPQLIEVLPELAASHTRGPQIASTENGITVTACNSMGDIFSFQKSPGQEWVQSARVNDMDTVAKENLMALSGDGKIAFAVWLDLRGNRHNKIVGAKTIDGGKTWSKNILIYNSPDSSVCECCKPSVAVKGNNVYVMFRNWLDGNRDLYLIQSTDGGNTFGNAQKMGNGAWTLKGCPMDGGGVVVNNGIPQTVWRREGKIYASEPGKLETEIGEGKGCTVETINGKNIYAWTENGEVVVMKPGGLKKSLGKGTLPVVKAINKEQFICVWENEHQIHKAVMELE